MGWTVWGSNPSGGEIFQTGPGAHPATCTMVIESFLGVKSGRGMTLTPHQLLLPWSRKGRAIPLLPLWAVQSLISCTRVHFTLPYLTYLALQLFLQQVTFQHVATLHSDTINSVLNTKTCIPGFPEKPYKQPIPCPWTANQVEHLFSTLGTYPIPWKLGVS